MKVLQVVALILVFVIIGNAQVDCAVINKVKVVDYDGNVVSNAKLELLKVGKNFSRISIFSLQKDESNDFVIKTFNSKIITETDESHYIGENYRLKITAEDFKEDERKIEFKRCESQAITIVLEKIKQDIKLSGEIYDENGAVIPNVKVTATNKQNQVFQTKSSEDGSYQLKLLPDIYIIEFEGTAFIKFRIEGFKVINSYKGSIQRDIILKPFNIEPCGYAGVCPPFIKEVYLIVESQKDFSKNIQTKPLEKIETKNN